LIQGWETTDTTRWNLVVSKQADKDLRQLLVAEGRGRKGELSRFVEESLAWDCGNRSADGLCARRHPLHEIHPLKLNRGVLKNVS
jgi:hypothetical protein